MDIQKIISDVVAKLTGNPELIKGFLGDPVKTLAKRTSVMVSRSFAEKLAERNQARRILQRLSGQKRDHGACVEELRRRPKR